LNNKYIRHAQWLPADKSGVPVHFTHSHLMQLTQQAVATPQNDPSHYSPFLSHKKLPFVVNYCHTQNRTYFLKIWKKVKMA
jgi:hypothetical protein